MRTSRTKGRSATVEMLATAGVKATTATLETSNRKDESNSMTVKTAGMKETTERPT